MESNSSFNIGKLNIRIGETHLQLTHSENGWNANIAYSDIKKAVKYIVEKLQETKAIV